LVLASGSKERRWRFASRLSAYYCKFAFARFGVEPLRIPAKTDLFISACETRGC
jgi:hypothetical protein